MKFLVDTCVWSLALRRQATARLSPDETRLIAQLADAIRDGQVVVVGPIRQEILSGISVPVRFQKILTALSAFADEALETSDYEEAARLSNLCRSRGVPSGTIDILLCAVARRRGWTILTNDRGLQRCIAALSAP